jgi:predicted transcriptional regulator
VADTTQQKEKIYMNYVYINFRAPADLVARIDELAEAEAKRTGLPVHRSAIIRRALEADLERRRQAEQKEGGDGN